jgi:hypothetical protein
MRSDQTPRVISLCGGVALFLASGAGLTWMYFADQMFLARATVAVAALLLWSVWLICRDLRTLWMHRRVKAE